MKVYETPELEILEFSAMDVIATSDSECETVLPGQCLPLGI